MATPYPLALFQGGSEYGPGQIPAFTTLVGVEPVILNCYLDGTQTPLPNTGSASYVASTFAGNAPWNDEVDGKRTKIPLIGSPMGSSGVSDAENLAYLQAIAAGEYDGQLTQFVTNFSENGFMTQYWRPGVEMNLTSTPGYNSYYQNPSLWIAAFQHIYTVFHAAAKAQGVTMMVIWNPGCASDTSAGNATKTLYPGAAYCDAIGGDSYDDLYPFAPMTDAEILASPASQKLFYSNPAMVSATDLDATNGIALPVPVLAAFARAQGKPFCICEGGAGKDPSDNPVWWEWLREVLDDHVEAGGEVLFVSMWDSNGGGSYQFTGGQQPNACAAIAANFGVNAPAAPGAMPKPAPGPEHAASPAGTQVNGPGAPIYDTAGNAWTITTAQTIAMNGTPVPISSDVVTLLWTGTELAQLNTSGDWWTQPLTGAAGTELTAAPAGYVAPSPAPTPTPTPTPTPAPAPAPALTVLSTTALPQSTFSVQLSADTYEGPALATIAVDGKVVAKGVSVSADHAENQWQDFTWLGSYGAGEHSITVEFTNDEYGGSATTDRNLYFGSATVDKVSYGSPEPLDSTGSTATIAVTTEY